MTKQNLVGPIARNSAWLGLGHNAVLLSGPTLKESTKALYERIMRRLKKQKHSKRFRPCPKTIRNFDKLSFLTSCVSDYRVNAKNPLHSNHN